MAVETYPTKAAAARAASGVDAWFVRHDRIRGRTRTRIVHAVKRLDGPAGQQLVFKDAQGREQFDSYWHSTYPTFAAAKANLLRETYDSLKDARRGLRDAKAEFRMIRAIRKPKAVRK